MQGRPAAVYLLDLYLPCLLYYTYYAPAEASNVEALARRACSSIACNHM